MQDQEQEKYFTEKSLAKRWGINFKTLQKWRWKGIGPPYIKIGIAVRYSPESIKKFEEERMRLHKGDNPSSCEKLLLTKNEINYESKQN